MSNYATLNGVRISSVDVSFPYYGLWTADVLFPTDVLPAGLAKLLLGTRELSCFVVPTRAGSFAGGASARLVGGFGGWNTEVYPQGYNAPGGLLVSTVLRDLAAVCGETFAEYDETATIDTHFLRVGGLASEALEQAVGAAWYVRDDGKTTLLPRKNDPIATPYTITERHAATGKITVATENPEDWTPGRTFSNFVVKEPQTIGWTRMIAGNDGKIRVEVIAQSIVMTAGLKSLIRSETLSTRFHGIYEYSVKKSVPGYVDVSPLVSWLPAVDGVPFVPGPTAATTTAKAGATAYIVFLNGDPNKPRCLSVSEVEDTRIADGTDYVALASLVATQLASHTHTGVTTGIGISGPALLIGSVAATKTRAK